MSIEESNVIDFVTLDGEGRAVLIMIEHRPWDTALERLQQLQDKVNAYLAFLDHDLATRYPDLAGRPVVFELRSVVPPDDENSAFLERIRVALARHGIPFVVRTVGERPMG